MSSMKRGLGMLSVLSAMAMMGSNNIYREEKSFDPADIDARPKKAPIPKGMKQWDIDGKIVYAATKKAAIKKASKIV